MQITNISVSNFKSFDHLKIDLHNFNILIGENASGKTNFVNIFIFLRDIVRYGLDNAISLQSGPEYFRNINISKTEPSAFGFTLQSTRRPRTIKTANYQLRIRPEEIICDFKIRFKQRGSSYVILEDKLLQKCRITNSVLEDGVVVKETTGECDIELSKEGKEITVGIRSAKSLELNYEVLLRRYLNLPHEPIHNHISEDREKKFYRVDYDVSANSLLIEDPYIFFPLFSGIEDLFYDLSIYSFDPKLSKRSVPISGKLELEEDGNNLAIILKNILGVAEKKRKFTNLVQDLIPFVDDIAIEKFVDKSLLMKLKESYGKNYLPASLLSEGTINTTALVVSLFFEDKEIRIIEEPERSIHPRLISKLVNLMKESSRKSQLIITTHNPQFIKYADLDDIVLIYRDQDGFSKMKRPSTIKKLKMFLKNNLGIEDLYVQSMLEFFSRE